MDTRVRTQHSINNASENFVNSKPKAGRGAARVSVTRAHAEIMLLDKAYVCDMIKQVKFLSLKTISVLFQRRPWEKISNRDASLKYSGKKK